ncbi:MAG: tetratricopeptide (TPR) repeat protein [Myxococcota bacterium]|jgi:tetratricopeptide (TPR) repeat protein
MGGLTALAAWLWLAPIAAAQEEDASERARTLFDDGAAAYEEGRYEDAIPLWEESWRLSMESLILYNLANAYERAGRLEDALDNLLRYAPGAPEDEQDLLDKRIDALEVRVAAIKAERDRAAAEEARREEQALAERRRIEQEAMSRSAVDERTKSPAGWIVGGIGAAALLTGAGFVAATGSSRGQLTTLCVDGDAGATCPVEAQPFVARNRTHRIAAWTGLGVGAIGIGVGGVLLAVPLDGRGVGLSFGRRW